MPVTLMLNSCRYRRWQIMKPFTAVAVLIFSLVAIAHLLRLYFHWEVTVNGLIVPSWVSIAGFIIAGALAVMLWWEMRKWRGKRSKLFNPYCSRRRNLLKCSNRRSRNIFMKMCLYRSIRYPWPSSFPCISRHSRTEDFNAELVETHLPDCSTPQWDVHRCAY